MATVHHRTSATSGCASPTACVCLSRKGRMSVCNRTVSSTKTCSQQPRFLKRNAPSTKCGRGIGFFARASSSKQTCFKDFRICAWSTGHCVNKFKILFCVNCHRSSLGNLDCCNSSFCPLIFHPKSTKNRLKNRGKRHSPQKSMKKRFLGRLFWEKVDFC